MANSNIFDMRKSSTSSSVDSQQLPTRRLSSADSNFLVLSNTISPPFIIPDISPVSPEFKAKSRNSSITEQIKLN
ncbi:unnamed protein product [[Candida] boidinii]|uniref:Unnamed protein product n=1 Tax=Candida boidinii TaxID=5477 RepID=A0A9W6SXR8_CANBO|nr:hypothetical protein B5S30_g127 [[Candida] boidinii]OWB81541.1 hypothetical protein B5S33_g159 [[Candida] boidinii]GME68240.1 unnamed protein product [[Candida] boidinii]GMF63848.1 unnamed protein product [[Candida] boidinii]GMG04492.1 unnamed protein product [[Candida] boidinii]